MTTSAPAAVSGGVPNPHSLLEIGAYFFKVGAFTIGGGLTMIPFIQDQVVGQFGWLTPREFIDGLALGQLTPGPLLMIAAYVGYKVASMAGAAVAATAVFLPSFIIMLVIFPVLDRVRKLAGVKAVMRRRLRWPDRPEESGGSPRERGGPAVGRRRVTDTRPHELGWRHRRSGGTPARVAPPPSQGWPDRPAASTRARKTGWQSKITDGASDDQAGFRRGRVAVATDPAE